MTNLDVSKTKVRNNPTEVKYTALTQLASGDKQFSASESRYGVQVVSDANDSRTVVLIKNSHTASVEVNVAPGNSPYNAENPLTITVPASKEVAVSLESALYKDLSIDGYILYTTDAKYEEISVACITLP